MDERQIQQVAVILQSWNPLGLEATRIPDLNGYRTEAIDIISSIGIVGKSKTPAKLVADVLNQAFDLTLTQAHCEPATKKIISALAGTH
jgi:hypothetical protein